jgi:hypothetical protein
MALQFHDLACCRRDPLGWAAQEKKQARLGGRAEMAAEQQVCRRIYQWVPYAS